MQQVTPYYMEELAERNKILSAVSKLYYVTTDEDRADNALDGITDVNDWGLKDGNPTVIRIKCTGNEFRECFAPFTIGKKTYAMKHYGTCDDQDSFKWWISRVTQTFEGNEAVISVYISGEV